MPLVLPSASKSAGVLAVEDFISEAEATQLKTDIDKSPELTLVANQGFMVPGPNLNARNLIDRIVGVIAEEFKVNVREEQTVAFKQGPGNSQVSHADAEILDSETGEWFVKSGVPGTWTHVGLLYLATCDSDFRGGHLKLTAKEITIRPLIGLLVAFPATHEYVHEVTEVLDGQRYVMAVWTEQA